MLIILQRVFGLEDHFDQKGMLDALDSAEMHLKYWTNTPLALGKFCNFDLKIINFLKIWRPISRLILNVERSFNHQNDRNKLNNVQNIFTRLIITLEMTQTRHQAFEKIVEVSGFFP